MERKDVIALIDDWHAIVAVLVGGVFLLPAGAGNVAAAAAAPKVIAVCMLLVFGWPPISALLRRSH